MVREAVGTWEGEGVEVGVSWYGVGGGANFERNFGVWQTLANLMAVSM